MQRKAVEAKLVIVQLRKNNVVFVLFVSVVLFYCACVLFYFTPSFPTFGSFCPMSTVVR